MQTVTNPCWFRNLIQDVVIEEQVLPRWLISLFYSRKPKELKDMYFNRSCWFSCQKNHLLGNLLPFREVISYLERGGINFVQLDIENELNVLTS